MQKKIVLICIIITVAWFAIFKLFPQSAYFEYEGQFISIELTNVTTIHPAYNYNYNNSLIIEQPYNFILSSNAQSIIIAEPLETVQRNGIRTSPHLFYPWPAELSFRIYNNYATVVSASEMRIVSYDDRDLMITVRRIPEGQVCCTVDLSREGVTVFCIGMIMKLI